MQEKASPLSLKNSWAYQSRLYVSAILFACTWMWVALTPPWVAKGSPIDWTADAAGWIVFLAGATLRIWATLWIAGRKRQMVVDEGPYRACRNPLYLGTFAMAVGVALILKSAAFAGALALVVLLYAFFVVPAEEAYLKSRLGQAYLDYQARVPRWFPALGALRRDELFRAVAGRGAVYREGFRMIWWMSLPVLAELTSQARGTPWWNLFSQ